MLVGRALGHIHNPRKIAINAAVAKRGGSVEESRAQHLDIRGARSRNGDAFDGEMPFTLCIVKPSCFIGSAVDFSQISQVLLGNDFSLGAREYRPVPRNDPFEVELSNRPKQTLRVFV